MKEILFAGIGGQGLILAANILARSAAATGLYAAQFQSYGSESRGTVSRAGVVIADDVVDFPHVEHADYFVAMAEPGLKLLKAKIVEKTVLLYDGSIFDLDEPLGREALNIEATKLSLEHFDKALFANIIMLGALLKKSDALAFDDVLAELKQIVPPKAIDQNVEALKLGYERC